jgi:hypothetical protein
MPASARLVAASAVAASLFATAPAVSADLYEPPWAHESGSVHYDDQRSADIYRGDAYRGDAYRRDEPRYERYAPPEDFEPAYEPARRADYDACVPREVARDRLQADGWGDFRDFERRGRVVLVQARRPSGRRFDLTIDRCSGEIIEARPLDNFRSYAYRSRY